MGESPANTIGTLQDKMEAKITEWFRSKLPLIDLSLVSIDYDSIQERPYVSVDLGGVSLVIDFGDGFPVMKLMDDTEDDLSDANNVRIEDRDAATKKMDKLKFPKEFRYLRDASQQDLLLEDLDISGLLRQYEEAVDGSSTEKINVAGEGAQLLKKLGINPYKLADQIERFTRKS